ncbi:hypothetical protein Cgig2_011326 [Carnegiea gigantea]|uniref:Uncharacterized protein n=1 Tax=Carnegiea gigantea TaxID=171969 RepID=A0A9Q1KDI0_9CARY|nr:hypothetical protein Cgig2_011326 [Carnegiea gigantea]
MAPTMVFGGKDAPRFASPHNDLLMVEMKIASAIMRRILVDAGSYVDIITWDCLNTLAHPGHGIVPMVNLILGFGMQEVYPSGMIRLSVRFGGKTKFKSLEVDFLGPGELYVGFSAILTTFFLGRTGLGLQGIGGLVLGSLTLGRRNELHLLGIVALRSSLFALVNKAQHGRHPPWLSPDGIEAPSFRARGPLYRPVASLSTSPSSRRQFATAFTPFVKTSAIAISSSEICGGSEASGFVSSQDLIISWIRVSFILASALMKLVEGREVNDEVRPAPGVAAPAPREGVGSACGVGARSPEDRLPDWGTDRWSALTPSAVGGVDTPVSRGVLQSFTSCGSTSSRRASSREEQRRVPVEEKSAYFLHTPYLFSFLGNEELTLFLPLALGSSSHLLGGSIPSFEDRQPGPRLICTK